MGIVLVGKKRDELMDRPRQAVILAGGRGTRLTPLTDDKPKPMIEFHGKPFLEYLIEMLREQGFERVLLLLGYLPDVVTDYFGDGSKWGVQIEYSISDVDNDTGKRIKLAEKMIDPVFLLMYCDNYWPMPFERMWEDFATSGATAMVTVYQNRDKYTRDNLRVAGDDFVEIYDKTRTAPDLQGVDIGFFILHKEVLDLVPDENVSFERTVYPELIRSGQLKAFLTGHRYYSVGSHERLKLTEEFLKREPAIILDRDGVLNKKAPKAQYICSWDDWQWIDGSREAVGLLTDAGYRIMIVTNQAGIARGFMDEAGLEDIHNRMKREIIEKNGQIARIYCCPHGWDDECQCRKPKPGMLFEAQRDFHLDLSRIYFVGDDERDQQAGEAAGCKTLLVSDKKPLLQMVKDVVLR